MGLLAVLLLQSVMLLVVKVQQLQSKQDADDTEEGKDEHRLGVVGHAIGTGIELVDASDAHGDEAQADVLYEEDDGESGPSGVNNQVGCDANVLSDLVLCLNLLRHSDNRLA